MQQRRFQQARAFRGTCCTAAARANAANMRDLAGALDKIRDSMITSYQAKTNLDREKLVALLDAHVSGHPPSSEKPVGFDPNETSARVLAAAETLKHRLDLIVRGLRRW
jgi:hypothetical protein